MRYTPTIFCVLLIQLATAQKISILFTSPSPNAVITTAPLKYNKDFAYSFTFDDATDDAFTCAYHIFNGGKVPVNDISYAGFFYTDGCGNKIPFRGGIAWNTANLNGIDVHTGNVQGQLTWKQLDTLYEGGWDIFNHSYSHKSRSIQTMTSADYTSEIALNPPAVKSRTSNKIDLPIFVTPAGDTAYHSYAAKMNYKAIFDQAGDVIGYGGLNIDKPFGFDKIIHRQLLEESLTSLHFFDSIAVKSLNGNHYWYNEFTHRIDNVTSPDFNFYVVNNYFYNISAKYGANGTDRMWMAPLQEVSEYLMMRRNLNFQIKANASLTDVSFDFTNVPLWFRRNSITLLVSNSNNIASIDVPKNWKVTFQKTGNTKVVNIDFGLAPFVNTPTLEVSKLSVFKIYPNITDEEIKIETLFDLTNAQFKLSDNYGRNYTIIPIGSGTFLTANISNLPTGFYYLSIISENKIYTERFVVVK